MWLNSSGTWIHSLLACWHFWCPARMSTMNRTLALQRRRPAIGPMILTLRGRRIILDSHLAQIYGIATFRLNEAIKRNRSRFPEDFMFRLTRAEFRTLTSQIAISKPARGGRRTLPYAFTEHGAIMAANVLKSARAAYMSIFVVRSFVRLRQTLEKSSDLQARLRGLEERLTKRLDSHERGIIYVLEELRKLRVPPQLPEPRKRPIGFGRE